MSDWPSANEWAPRKGTDIVEWKGRPDVANRYPGYQNEYPAADKFTLEPGEIIFDRWGRPRGVVLERAQVLIRYSEAAQ